MTIYLHGAKLQQEHLNALDTFLKGMGYEKAAINLPILQTSNVLSNKREILRSWLPEYVHKNRTLYPVITVNDLKVSIDDTGASLYTQPILGFMITELQPTHWNTDLEVFATNLQNPERRYRQKFVIDLPYVPLSGVPVNNEKLADKLK